jgi:hypothetical protein
VLPQLRTLERDDIALTHSVIPAQAGMTNEMAGST